MTVNKNNNNSATAKATLWKYVRCCPRWRPHLQIIGTNKSWLGCRDGVVCCLACPDVKFENAASLQLCNLLRHHRSLSHANHASAYFGKIDLHGKPPTTDQFRALLGHVLQKGAHGRLKRGPESPDDPNTLALPTSWTKRRRMEWCLAEAKRNSDRRFLRQATVASLMVDGRNGSLLVRLAAADAQLNTKSMVLGLKHRYGSTAEHAQKAIKAVIDNMCTTGRGAPPRGTQDSRGGHGGQTPDLELAQRVRRMVEVFAADAASDEQLAGRELQCPTGGGPPALPNLKVIVRDKAHASRRLLSRPWAADAYLKATLDVLLFKQKSIVRLIQNSFIFKSWFVANQRHDGHEHHGNQPLKDLSYAGQRFDSRAKPLARFCWKFDAVVQTAMQIAVRRRGKAEGAAAAEFLAALSLENMLQVGMLADAADEGLRFTRFCDSEGMDLGSISGEVKDFASRISCLFTGRQAMHSGFTKLMLEAIKRVRVVFLGRCPLTIGDAAGPNPEVIGRCFARMACWVRLCISILKAEFPAFEVVQCFSVFNLGGHGGRGGHGGHGGRAGLVHPDDAAKFQRLALLCQVDPGKLRAEFADLQPTACRIHADEGCDVLGAWQRAVAVVTRTPAMVRKHPIPALLSVLQRFAAYRASTSGVEQSFAHLHFVEKAKRSDTSEQAELDSLTLRLDTPASLHEPMISEAQRLWTRHYGLCRKGGRRRFVGPKNTVMTVLKVPKVHKTLTETQLLKDRRDQVAAASRNHRVDLDAVLAAARRTGQSAWTSAHQKEADMQAVRALGCRAEMAETGLLLPTECNRSVAQATTVLAQKRLNNWKERHRRQAVMTILEQRPAANLANVRVHIAQDLPCTPASICKAIIQHRLRRCDDLAQADVFVVQDPTRVGILTQLAVSLRGGRLVTPRYLFSGGAAGASVAFRPAMRQPKWIWVSNRFQQQHPRIFNILKAVMTVPHRWRWIDSCSAYLLRCRGKALAQQRQLIGLVTVVDKLRGRAVPGVPKSRTRS